MKGDIIKQINAAFIDMVSCSIYKADISRRLAGFATTMTGGFFFRRFELAILV